MIYLLFVAAAVITIAAFGTRSPRTMRTLGAVALGIAIIAIVVAEVTGNVLLFYVGALAAPFGLGILFFWGVDAIRSHGTARRDRPR